MGQTETEIAAVLHHFGVGGYPAGRFTASLVEAAAAADPYNGCRLAAAFPVIVSAVNLVKNHEDGARVLDDWLTSSGNSIAQLHEILELAR